ncbi:MAG: hypothetical protein AAF098_16805 [Pseudomonadota bacterium]
MVGVFSQERKTSSAAGRLRGYTTYAIGEITLIVIGILIALQLDAAQQAKSERALEQKYIKALIDDLQFDVERSAVWFDNFEAKVSGLQAAKNFFFDGVVPQDVDAFLASVGIGGKASRGRLVTDTSTFRDLISTGSLRYLRDDGIKAAILNFYDRKDFVVYYAANIRTEYANYTNAVLPYDPGGVLVRDPRDIQQALSQFRKPEFLALINQELTFAYSVNRVMSNHRANAIELAEKLEAYLVSG